MNAKIVFKMMAGLMLVAPAGAMADSLPRGVERRIERYEGRKGSWMESLSELEVYSEGNALTQKYRYRTIPAGTKFEVLRWNDHMTLVRLQDGQVAFLRRKFQENWQKSNGEVGKAGAETMKATPPPLPISKKEAQIPAPQVTAPTSPEPTVVPPPVAKVSAPAPQLDPVDETAKWGSISDTVVFQPEGKSLFSIGNDGTYTSSDIAAMIKQKESAVPAPADVSVPATEGKKVDPSKNSGGLTGYLNRIAAKALGTLVGDKKAIEKKSDEAVKAPTVPSTPVVATQPDANKTTNPEVSVPGVVVHESDPFNPAAADKAPASTDAKNLPAITDVAKAQAKADVPQSQPTAQTPEQACSAKGGFWHTDHCHEGTQVVQDAKPAETAKVDEKLAQEGGKTCNDWQSPMRQKYRITDCQGSARRGSRRHAGLDLNTYDTSKPNDGKGLAAPIYSVGPGKVANAGWIDGYGCTIAVQHKDCPTGLDPYKNFQNEKCISFYAHLKQEKGGKCPMTKKIGSQVDSCTQIARMGGTGGNYPVHLHFEFRLPTKTNLRLNPLVALREIEMSKDNQGVKNKQTCERSRSWVASSAMGSPTHSAANYDYVDKSSKKASRRVAGRGD